MNTVTLMVTLHYPGDPPDVNDREDINDNIHNAIQVAYEDGVFAGCSHFEVEVENAD